MVGLPPAVSFLGAGASSVFPGVVSPVTYPVWGGSRYLMGCDARLLYGRA